MLPRLKASSRGAACASAANTIMAQKLLTRAQVRELDRQAIEVYGLPGIVLMENAGRGAATLLLRLGIQGRVVICCGKGNNGGDGLVMARHLDARGIPVQILLLPATQELSGDAATHLRVAERSKLTILQLPPGEQPEAWLANVFRGADWIVDALFGTGLSGPLRSPYDSTVRAINGAGAGVFAVDIPSGLDCDTGQPLGTTVKASHTATFVAPKIGFTNPSAARWLGVLHVLDIGLPRRLLENANSM